MTAVDAVPRRDSHLDRAQSARRWALTGADSAAAATDHIGRAEAFPADPWAPAGTREDVFELIYTQFLSSAPAGCVSGRGATRLAESGGYQVEEDPGGMYLLAAIFVDAGGPGSIRAIPLLRRLSNIAARLPDHRLWRRRLEFLLAAQAERVADTAGVLSHCRAAEELTGLGEVGSGGPSSEPDGDDFLRSMDVVIAEQLPGLALRAHLRRGETHLAEILLRSRFGGPDGAEDSEPATLALLACQHGRLDDACRLAMSALAAVETRGGAIALAELDARLVLGEVFFERNDLAAAQLQLETALRGCWSTGARHSMWAVEADLIRLMVAQQRAPEAHYRLGTLRRAIGPDLTAGPLRYKLNQADIDTRIALGDLDSAVALARSLATDDLPCETRARLDLSSGRPDRALARLGAGPEGSPGAKIRRLVLRACAQRQEGRWQEAAASMRRAVDEARRDRYVRPFLEAPTLTVPLLRGLFDSCRDGYISELISAGEQLTPAGSLPTSAGMLEPLTERERQVLRHLSSHQTLPQIAVVMGVSTNTIKTHVKSIYRKTGAISRHEAVTIARTHGVL